MSRVLVIGSSGGIGLELSQAFYAIGRDVVGLSQRSIDLDIMDVDSVGSLTSELNGPLKQML